MTLLIAFHESGYRTFKHFYQKHVCIYWCAEFPNLVSYSRFVQLKQEVLTVLTFYLSAHLGTCNGFKLHLVINDSGELLDVALTPGNTNDRKSLRDFADRLHGSLYADRGNHISKDLRETLRQQGVDLVYKVRKNMKPRFPLSVSDEVLLKKRMLIEKPRQMLRFSRQLTALCAKFNLIFV